MNNLNLPQVAFSQKSKEVTINEQATDLDAALTEALTVDLSTADVALTQDQFTRNFVFVASGNTIARTLTVYASKRPFAVRNSGTADLTVRATGAGVVVKPGSVKLLRCDGALVAQLAAEDAPNDGAGYVRLGEAWAELVAGANVALDATTPGEFKISASGGGGTTLPSMTGNAGNVLAVNATEDGAEWVPQSGGGAKPWYWNPPSAASFTKLTGGATTFDIADDPDVGFQCSVVASSGATTDHLLYRTLTDPSLDWVLTARFNLTLDVTNYAGVGIVVMDTVSGEIMHLALDARATLIWTKLTNISLWSADTRNVVFRWAPCWLRFRSEGSTLYGDVSADGKTWHKFYSESVTAFLNNRADRVGLVVMTGRTIGVEFSCDHFSLTGPAV